MTKRSPSLKTLQKRRLRPGDCPIVIRYAWWTKWVHLVALPLLLALTGLFALAFYYFVSVGDWAVAFGVGLLTMLFGIGWMTGVDNAFRYRLIIDVDGVRTHGNLVKRHFYWNEITHFDTWRNRTITDNGVIGLGYQARIHVDGRNNRRRLLRNLYFAGHFTPPGLELGGKDLAALLTKAKRQLESAATETPASAPGKDAAA